jgi:aminopeptidase N
MDIARTPSTPDGNPEMADAAPEPKAPLLIRREDYAPFPWLVPEIALEFDLGLDKTRVRALLTVQRNARAPAASSIRLNGDGSNRSKSSSTASRSTRGASTATTCSCRSQAKRMPSS